MPPGPVRTIFVLSDATGDTAEKVVRAALRQFDVGSVAVDIRLFSHLRSSEDLCRVVDEAAEVRALLVFTIVRADFREELRQRCEARGVPCVDLIGALMGAMSGFFGVAPRGVPGLLHTVSPDYYRRMEAIEFTVKSDDGRDPANLPKADLVLVGISRTSKTPLSTYIAQKGFKVANVPLVIDVPLPPELAQVDPRRVFGLTIKPDALLQIRRARLERLRMAPDTSYGQRDHILREIYYARSLFESNPSWPVIDITGKAIEETASDILRIYKQRGLLRSSEDDSDPSL
ncbi:MAG: pyruvate, water dikinase regulatory protein [Myxococcales bacterium]|nr:pyruvate, water dikinase regulatory protein [Myxococcales bacterium]